MTSVANPAATARTRSHAFAGVFAVLARHLAELDRFLRERLAEFEPEIRAMVDRCLDTSAPRIRPALVFLSGWRGAGGITPDLVRVAAVIELVHLATLVHEDLGKEAGVRRRGRAASRAPGSAPAVLLGDALFAHGLHLATQFPTTEICGAVTASIRRVCAGEIVRTPRRSPASFTRDDWRRTADLTSGEFFRVSCMLGARLAGSEPGHVEAVGRFGRHLGLACGLYDDLGDFLGGKERIGRAPDSDRASGKLTLPLLALLERLPAAEADALRAEIAGERPPQLALRRRQMGEFALFPAMADVVRAELAAAAAALREWPGQASTPLLLGLGEELRARVADLRPAGAA